MQNQRIQGHRRLWRGLTVGLSLTLVACVDNTSQPGALGDYQSAQSPSTCVPNLDGQIDAAELTALYGVAASYRVSPAGLTRSIDIAGSIDAEGHRVWDWSARNNDDQIAKISAQTLGSQWYAPSFPEGQFVVPFDAGDQIEAIYKKDNNGLFLLGLASHDQAPAQGKTLLPYDQPIAALRFPLAVGKTWTTTAKTQAGKGMYHGIPFASSDTYAVSVDAAGRLELPDLTVTQALRVRTQVTIVPVAGLTTTQRQVSMMFECLGEVARAVSQSNESQQDFQTASEVRRLAL